MKEQTAGVPHHIAIIMDGNGRWAKKRLLPRGAGHRAGLKRMISLSEAIFERGVKICTLFALSTENLSRPQEELQGLFTLFREYFEKNVARLAEKEIELKIIGNLTLLPEDIGEIIRKGEEQTRGGQTGTLVLAIGYGGRQDILAAVNEAVRQGKEVNEKEFSSLLSTKDFPEPDLLIRTGKELRISNFLLWQSAYTEFYFTDTLFPDFSDRELNAALASYAARERRYGKL
ncbi:MAG: di-trans,poly-cis-decaprenylcistransferase [Clostridia bacterium]|jgi:undecaprenyl diphosphate synthase|nr:di-trans,poly-cis-decaprenylcistransferase [Clostridia bacterium]